MLGDHPSVHERSAIYGPWAPLCHTPTRAGPRVMDALWIGAGACTPLAGRARLLSLQLQRSHAIAAMVAAAAWKEEEEAPFKTRLEQSDGANSVHRRGVLRVARLGEMSPIGLHPKLAPAAHV